MCEMDERTNRLEGVLGNLMYIPKLLPRANPITFAAHYIVGDLDHLYVDIHLHGGDVVVMPYRRVYFIGHEGYKFVGNSAVYQLDRPYIRVCRLCIHPLRGARR